MNRNPNLTFLGGTMIIAIIVIAAFTNVANAGNFYYCMSISAGVTTEQFKDTFDKKPEVKS